MIVDLRFNGNKQSFTKIGLAKLGLAKIGYEKNYCRYSAQKHVYVKKNMEDKYKYN